LPQPKEIKVKLIAFTTVDKEAIKECLPHADITQEVTDGDLLIGIAGKNCYNSFSTELNKNLTRVRKEWVEFLDNLLKQGHGSVLEHSSFSFYIEGLTRVATPELNRHRAGVAISERSLRYCRFDNIEYWVPLSIRDNPDDPPDLRTKKDLSRAILENTFANQEAAYKELEKIWDIDNQSMHVKKQLTSMFRRIVGQGCSTAGVWTFNVRALRHIITMRCTPQAEEEICEIYTSW